MKGTVNRGVVNLTNEEIQFGLQLSQTNNFDQLLIQKLTAAIQAPTNPTVVELSEDQVEQIIDVLPAPQESNPVMKSLRVKLTQFLSQLRAKKIAAGSKSSPQTSA